MSHRPAQHTPPVAPPRHKLALVTWAGAYGVITLIIWQELGARGASQLIIDAHDRVQG